MVRGILHVPYGFPAQGASQAGLASGTSRGCLGCAQPCALTLLSRCSQPPGDWKTKTKTSFIFPKT